MSKTHELKIWPEYYEAVLDGRKPFELRKNDRDFKEFDTIHLREWCPTRKKYTGRECKAFVTYAFYGPAIGLKEGFCIMGLDRDIIEWPEAEK